MLWAIALSLTMLVRSSNLCISNAMPFVMDVVCNGYSINSYIPLNNDIDMGMAKNNAIIM